MTVWIYIAAIAFCIAGSAWFSATEMSLSSVSRIRIEHAAEHGNRKARTTLYILGHFDHALSTILVGNNLVNIAASSLGTVAVVLTLGDSSTWISTAVITAAVIVCGETIPKISAKKNATRVSLFVSPLLRLLMTLLTPVTVPVVGAVNLITSFLKGEEESGTGVEELQSIIDMAESEEVLDEEASDLVNAAIDFQNVSAAEVMTARVDILAIDAEDDWVDILDTIEHSPYSRLPVYEDSVDNIIGVLPVDRVLRALIDAEQVDIRPLLLKPCYVYRTMKLPAVMKAFRASRQHLAIVTDEYGGTLGLVSMEDVLHELVGDMWEEDGEDAESAEKQENSWELDGDMPLSEFAELMKWRNVRSEFLSHTLGGWCIEMLNRFPDEGSSFTYRDVGLTVLEADDRRVRKVLVERPGKAAEGD